MSKGVSFGTHEARSKEKQFATSNVKPKTKCACGKGLGYMQIKCLKCQKAAA